MNRPRKQQQETRGNRLSLESAEFYSADAQVSNDTTLTYKKIVHDAFSLLEHKSPVELKKPYSSSTDGGGLPSEAKLHLLRDKMLADHLSTAVLGTSSNTPAESLNILSGNANILTSNVNYISNNNFSMQGSTNRAPSEMNQSRRNSEADSLFTSLPRLAGSRHRRLSAAERQSKIEDERCGMLTLPRALMGSPILSRPPAAYLPEREKRAYRLEHTMENVMRGRGQCEGPAPLEELVELVNKQQEHLEAMTPSIEEEIESVILPLIHSSVDNTPEAVDKPVAQSAVRSHLISHLDGKMITNDDNENVSILSLKNSSSLFTPQPPSCVSHNVEFNPENPIYNARYFTTIATATNEGVNQYTQEAREATLQYKGNTNITYLTDENKETVSHIHSRAVPANATSLSSNKENTAVDLKTAGLSFSSSSFEISRKILTALTPLQLANLSLAIEELSADEKELRHFIITREQFELECVAHVIRLRVQNNIIGPLIAVLLQEERAMRSDLYALEKRGHIRISELSRRSHLSAVSATEERIRRQQLIEAAQGFIPKKPATEISAQNIVRYNRKTLSQRSSTILAQHTQTPVVPCMDNSREWTPIGLTPLTAAPIGDVESAEDIVVRLAKQKEAKQRLQAESLIKGEEGKFLDNVSDLREGFASFCLIGDNISNDNSPFDDNSSSQSSLKESLKGSQQVITTPGRVFMGRLKRPNTGGKNSTPRNSMVCNNPELVAISGVVGSIAKIESPVFAFNDPFQSMTAEEVDQGDDLSIELITSKAIMYTVSPAAYGVVFQKQRRMSQLRLQQLIEEAEEDLELFGDEADEGIRLDDFSISKLFQQPQTLVQLLAQSGVSNRNNTNDSSPSLSLSTTGPLPPTTRPSAEYENLLHEAKLKYAATVAEELEKDQGKVSPATAAIRRHSTALMLMEHKLALEREEKEKKELDSPTTVTKKAIYIRPSAEDTSVPQPQSLGKTGQLSRAFLASVAAVSDTVVMSTGFLNRSVVPLFAKLSLPPHIFNGLSILEAHVRTDIIEENFRHFKARIVEQWNIDLMGIRAVEHRQRHLERLIMWREQREKNERHAVATLRLARELIVLQDAEAETRQLDIIDVEEEEFFQGIKLLNFKIFRSLQRKQVEDLESETRLYVESLYISNALIPVLIERETSERLFLTESVYPTTLPPLFLSVKRNITHLQLIERVHRDSIRKIQCAVRKLRLGLFGWRHTHKLIGSEIQLMRGRKEAKKCKAVVAAACKQLVEERSKIADEIANEHLQKRLVVHDNENKDRSDLVFEESWSRQRIACSRVTEFLYNFLNPMKKKIEEREPLERQAIYDEAFIHDIFGKKRVLFNKYMGILRRKHTLDSIMVFETRDYISHEEEHQRSIIRIAMLKERHDVIHIEENRLAMHAGKVAVVKKQEELDRYELCGAENLEFTSAIFTGFVMDQIYIIASTTSFKNNVWIPYLNEFTELFNTYAPENHVQLGAWLLREYTLGIIWAKIYSIEHSVEPYLRAVNVEDEESEARSAIVYKLFPDSLFSATQKTKIREKAGVKIQRWVRNVARGGIVGHSGTIAYLARQMQPKRERISFYKYMDSQRDVVERARQELEDEIRWHHVETIKEFCPLFLKLLNVEEGLRQRIEDEGLFMTNLLYRNHLAVVESVIRQQTTECANAESYWRQRIIDEYKKSYNNEIKLKMDIFKNDVKIRPAQRAWRVYCAKKEYRRLIDEYLSAFSIREHLNRNHIEMTECTEFVFNILKPQSRYQYFCHKYLYEDLPRLLAYRCFDINVNSGISLEESHERSKILWLQQNVHRYYLIEEEERASRMKIYQFNYDLFEAEHADRNAIVNEYYLLLFRVLIAIDVCHRTELLTQYECHSDMYATYQHNRAAATLCDEATAQRITSIECASRNGVISEEQTERGRLCILYAEYEYIQYPRSHWRTFITCMIAKQEEEQRHMLFTQWSEGFYFRIVLPCEEACARNRIEWEWLTHGWFYRPTTYAEEDECGFYIDHNSIFLFCCEAMEAEQRQLTLLKDDVVCFWIKMHRYRAETLDHLLLRGSAQSVLSDPVELIRPLLAKESVSYADSKDVAVLNDGNSPSDERVDEDAPVINVDNFPSEENVVGKAHLNHGNKTEMSPNRSSISTPQTDSTDDLNPLSPCSVDEKKKNISTSFNDNEKNKMPTVLSDGVAVDNPIAPLGEGYVTPITNNVDMVVQSPPEPSSSSPPQQLLYNPNTNIPEIVISPESLDAAINEEDICEDEI